MRKLINLLTLLIRREVIWEGSQRGKDRLISQWLMAAPQREKKQFFVHYIWLKFLSGQLAKNDKNGLAAHCRFEYD
jgi:hypothetical protein